MGTVEHSVTVVIVMVEYGREFNYRTYHEGSEFW